MNFEIIANQFLEISSEQRLQIIHLLKEKKLNLSKIAKELDASSPEIHRNLSRLIKSNFIEKNSDSNYSLTVIGQILCDLIPSFFFLQSNHEFFRTHSMGKLEQKFIQRIGSLKNHKKIRGFVNVLEKWKDIHKNSEKYVYNILPEVPYSQEIIDIVENKLDLGIPVCSIFSESTIIPDEREKIFKAKNFQKFVKDEILQRRMIKEISIVVILNENESGIIFPLKNEGIDLSFMFYSDKPEFHEWCLDYFNFMWKESGSFMEHKLK